MRASAESQPTAAPAMSLEYALGAVLGQMRAQAEASRKDPQCGDDYSITWTAEVMDSRPLIFVAAILPGESSQTMAWLMEPNGRVRGRSDDRVSVLIAEHEPPSDGFPAWGRAEWARKSKLHVDIADAVNWLVSDKYGDFLDE